MYLLYNKNEIRLGSLV